jgi:anti-anti-sigma factor
VWNRGFGLADSKKDEAMKNDRPVIVQELPDKLTGGKATQFLREVEPFLRAERPRIVFDLSRVGQLDCSGVEILLLCMEEVMKRNGDLKLAAIPSGPAVILEMMRVDRLFETFETVSEAVESFDYLPGHAFPLPQQGFSITAAGGD